MFSYFVVAIGGALGSVGRFWLSGAIAQKFGETFPAGTLLVNISGSFIIGFFAALTGPDGRIWSSPSFRQFFMIGVLGGRWSHLVESEFPPVFYDRRARGLHDVFFFQLANTRPCP